MDTPRLTRRQLLTAGAAVPLATAAAATVIQREMPWDEGRAERPLPLKTAHEPNQRYVFFNAAEAAFVEAAVARLIPKDDLGPGALETGVPLFIDRQLDGDYGRATTWYMQGPWDKGESTQGYQSRLTPAGMYRAAVRDIDQAVSREGRAPAFAKLAADAQDDWLHRLEDGTVTLAGVDAKGFFKLLLQNTVEGFFADPIYGGNRDMAGWRLIGFPGARYDHTPYVQKHGEKYPLPPVGLEGRVEWMKKA